MSRRAWPRRGHRFVTMDPASTLILIREGVEAVLDDARHSNVSKRDQGQLDMVNIPEHVGPVQIG